MNFLVKISAIYINYYTILQSELYVYAREGIRIRMFPIQQQNQTRW